MLCNAFQCAGHPSKLPLPVGRVIWILIYYTVLLSQHNSVTKLAHDRFIRFCTAQLCEQHTQTCTKKPKLRDSAENEFEDL